MNAQIARYKAAIKFQHAVVVGDGFQYGWASKPVGGVFDVEGGHDRRLYCALFGYTVIGA